MWHILVIGFLFGNHYSVSVYPNASYKTEKECLTEIEAYHKAYPADDPKMILACIPEKNITKFIGK
jgi:hypothetical protein